MAGFSIKAFRGQIPRRDSRLLDGNYAEAAANCKIKSGRIDPIKGLLLTHTSLASSIATMYRYRFGSIYNWLVSGRVVDYCRSPVAQDSLGRFYYTGDAEPRMSTYADAISGGGPYPAAWFVLGVTPPVTAMSISCAGGVGINESRAYVYTFVTKYGEESGPSPATIFTGKVDDTWSLSAMNAAPPNTGTVSAAVKDTPLVGQVQVTMNSVFGLSANEEITFSGVVGMTDLNATFKLVSVDPVAGKVVVALATTQTYTSGGAWARVAPHNTSSMTKRIYRTVGTGTDYKFVAEIAVATTTYSDTIPSTTVSLNNGIPTLNTLPPPKDMISLVLLANNAMAGLSGNQLCLSEQGKPYSWPLSNRYAFPGSGVALVASGNSVIILTDGIPHIATATVPEAASVAKVPGEALAPCISKTGVVDIGGAALYPSHDGLYLATTAGVRNVTEGLYTLDDWQKLLPATFKAAFYDGLYHAQHQTVTISKILMLDSKLPDSTVECNESADALYLNPWDGRLYLAKSNKIYQWDADDNNRYVASWQSKVYQFPKPISMVAAQVHAEYSDIIPVNNTILNANIALLADVRNVNGEIACAEVGIYEVAASAIQPVPAQTAAFMQFSLIRSGVPVFSKYVKSNASFKITGGKKSELYAVQISSSIGVHFVNVAESMTELGTIP